MDIAESDNLNNFPENRAAVFRDTIIGQLICSLILLAGLFGCFSWLIFAPLFELETGVMMIVGMWLIWNSLQPTGSLFLQALFMGMAMIVLWSFVATEQGSLPAWLRYGPFSATGFFVAVLSLAAVNLLDHLWPRIQGGQP